jgi:hypothetical protein
MVYLREEFHEWHAKECLLGECENCGVDNLLICPIDEDVLSYFLVY